MFTAPTVSADGELPGDEMPPIDRPAVRQLADVARRDGHQDAGVGRPLHGLAQRIVPLRLHHRVPQRHVDDLDVPQAPVVDRPVERLDHVARLARAVRAHRLQAEEVGARARRRG